MISLPKGLFTRCNIIKNLKETERYYVTQFNYYLEETIKYLEETIKYLEKTLENA